MISEPLYDGGETAALVRGRVVFVEPEDLPAAALFYTLRPDLRAAATRRGAGALAALAQWRVLGGELDRIAGAREAAAACASPEQ